MKESNWGDCIESKSSVKVSPDKAKSRSLIDTADGRTDYLKEISIDEDNANYIFESYYSSVLELLHALAIMKGYNVRNHICIGFYIRDVLKRGDLFRIFDDIRFKRNSLTYYGRRMEFKTAEKAIKDSISLIRSLKGLL